ncbi:MAG TPA: PHP domain-containing protein [Solirubrobacteraceae bacterium]|nr:PHP domain-containing protein [Solirubrobacteraceae bacterium]
MAERFSFAQVTPYPWEERHEVNEFVASLSDQLVDRGHRVAIIAPSRSQALVRDSRRAIRSARDNPEALLERSAEGPRVLGVGEVLPFRSARTRRSLPIDVARTIEEALAIAPLDFVHVHEPFAPSTASAALRHSRSLNIGSFHAPSERILSTQVARRVVELFFGRLDARTASYGVTRELMRRFFPAEYRVIEPGAEQAAVSGGAAAPRDRPVEILFVAGEERPALRLFLRALRRLELTDDWHATIWSEAGAPAASALSARLRERVTFCVAEDCSEQEAMAHAEIVVCASNGTQPAPALLRRALAMSAVPLAARLPAYEEILREGEYGLLFEPTEVETLAGQLTRLVNDRELRARLRTAADAARERLSWARVADDFEQLYGEVAVRRHDADHAEPALRKRVRSRKLIDVDLHMHTDHSHDCATPVEALLDTAKARGLGAIAVTDHNEISGALEARAKANGVKVIVAEEVKTAGEGEVIGLFIEEKIERGLSLAETIAEIKRQGGLVYVPHPFDRLHTVPDYEHLLPVLADVDAIEVFNPRVAISSFNEEAVRFAAKYRVVCGAGSDAHVTQGLGSVRIRMRDFHGPQEFLHSLREADIIRKPKSLVYVQALKFLQTKATPAAARPAARKRRIRRAARRAGTGGAGRKTGGRERKS